MTSLIQRALGRSKRSIVTVEDYLTAVETFGYAGNTYGLTGVQQTQNGFNVERIRSDFEGLANQLYAANSIVFSLMAVRQLAFSSIRFQYQQFNKGRPDKLYSTPELRGLEKPWAGGTTGDLLARMISDADLAGNSYWTRISEEMVRLRPDWVDIVLRPRAVPFINQQGEPDMGAVGDEIAGYLYWHGGRGQEKEPMPFLPHEVAHFAPYPDPLATYRGMSWLSPLVREISGDRFMNAHKERFFRNGATPNMVIRHDPGVTVQDARLFKEFFDREYQGVENAYKPLHLGGGADVTIVGADFKQVDFAVVQGHTETRISAAAGVPPIIPGFSEGLASATYSNYQQALRRFVGLTMHPLWQNAAGSLEQIFKPQAGSRLWYDTRDIAFLREDAAALSEIQQNQAATISSYISAGFTPESAVQAVTQDDPELLVHTGLVSVQLWTPGAQTDPTDGGSTDAGGSTGGSGGNGSLAGDEPDSTPPQEQ